MRFGFENKHVFGLMDILILYNTNMSRTTGGRTAVLNTGGMTFDFRERLLVLLVLLWRIFVGLDSCRRSPYLRFCHQWQGSRSRVLGTVWF